MNQTAIERTAGIIERMDKLLRRRLTEKQLTDSEGNISYAMEKPDKHVCRILGANYLGCSDSETVPMSEAMEIIAQLASLCGRRAAEVNYIL